MGRVRSWIYKVIQIDKSIESDLIGRNIRGRLLKASFVLKYPNMTPDREHITDKYDAWLGGITTSYV